MMLTGYLQMFGGRPVFLRRILPALAVVFQLYGAAQGQELKPSEPEGAGYQVEGILPSRPIVSPTAMALNVFDWLFNPRRSVLLFVPVLLLALPGLPGAWRSVSRRISSKPI
jgi:hypothetical protein